MRLDNPLLAQALLALQSEKEDISLVIWRGTPLYVFKNDWLYSVVPPAQRDLKIARPEASPIPPISFAERLLVEHARSGCVFLDVGTNYGQWVIRAHRVLKDAGLAPRTICFEPGQAGRLALVNLALNGVDAEYRAAAVGNSTGIVPVFADAGHTEDNKLVNPGPASRTFPTVCYRLSDLISEVGTKRLIFAKIDTQGAEYEVYQGLGEFARSGNFVAVMEFSPKAISSRIKPSRFLEMISSDGFLIIELDAEQNDVGQLEPRDFDSFCARIWQQRQPFCDLALVPGRLSHYVTLICSSVQPQ